MKLLQHRFEALTTMRLELCSRDTWEKFTGSHREQWISKSAAMRYLSFAASRRMRLTGERGMGRHGQCPDLIEQYGFDVKFAMRYVRWLGWCRELLREHRVTLPRPEKELLIAIPTGKYTRHQVSELGDDLTLANNCSRTVTFATGVDATPLSQRIADAYQSHWQLCSSTDD